MSKLPQPPDTPGERVVLDASVLLGNRRRHLFAATDLSYYLGYWSSWIVKFPEAEAAFRQYLQASHPTPHR